MTLKEMLVQGDFVQLIIMGILFVSWVIMIFRIGNGVAAKVAAEKSKQKAPAAAVSANNNAVTAAITAAVSEYRKK